MAQRHTFCFDSWADNTEKTTPTTRKPQCVTADASRAIQSILSVIHVTAHATGSSVGTLKRTIVAYKQRRNGVLYSGLPRRLRHIF
jgi:hypothetical protein